MTKDFYVDCRTNMFAQHPIVRTNEKIVARRFKGVMYEEAEKRAEKLAEILNRRLDSELFHGVLEMVNPNNPHWRKKE